MTKKSSRDNIIKTATELLSRKGLEVSIREINETAGLSAAATHYHFKNKHELISAVLRSRMLPVDEREGKIDKLLASGQTPTVRDVVKLLVYPLASIMLDDPEGGRDYIRVVARVYSEQGRDSLYPMIDEFQVPVEKLLRALSHALPDLPPGGLKLRYGFAMETMLNTLACANFPNHIAAVNFPNTVVKQTAIIDALIDYITGGLAQSNDKSNKITA